MKTKLSTLLIGVVLVGLTACNDKGGSSGNNEAAIPGLPTGRISATQNGIVDSNNYCDVAPDQRSMTCATLVPTMGGNPITCPAPVIAYTDLTTMCQNLLTAMNTVNNTGVINNACNATSGRLAMQSMYSRSCTGVINSNLPGQTVPPPLIGGGNINPIQNTAAALIRCDVNAVRYCGGLTQKFNSSAFLFANSGRPSLSSQSLFGFSSRLGSYDFSYDSRGERLTINARGINKDTNVTQTGYSGQEVRLEVANEDGTVNVEVSCKDTAGVRSLNRNVRSYECLGTSNLGYRIEKIKKTFDVEDLMYGEVELARKLTLSASQGSSGLNNALITLSAKGVSAADSTVLSSAYIGATAEIKINDGSNQVEVTCKPKR